MAEHFRTSVVLNGQTLRSIHRIGINQELFNHLRFDVLLPLSSLVNFVNQDDPFPIIQDCIGKPIEITIKTATDADRDGELDQSVFKGIVTDVYVDGHRWEHDMINISGAGTTILMDGIPNTQAFNQKSLKQIFDTCVEKHLSSEIKIEDNLTYTDKLLYTVQYEESDFDFIKRLCYQYGEWCYYNGEKLCLGLKPTDKIFTLTKDRILSLNYNYSVTPVHSNMVFRDYQKNGIENLEPARPTFADQMAKHSLDESFNLYPGSSSAKMYTASSRSGDNLQNEKNQHQHRLNVLQKARLANVLMVNCESDVAGITVGSIVKLDKMHHNGEFVVTSISHNVHEASSYSNYFFAIPKDAIFPEMSDISFPKVKECSAIVKDNKDPEKLGRVKVAFDWSGDTMSPWLRVIMPHAGGNRGFYFVPEIGDEVMVGFEMGNPDHPYVIGSLYNGEFNFENRAKDKNNLKAIRTRSGNEILLDDNGRITIRNHHNKIELACAEDGSITIQTDGEMTFKSGKKMEFETEEEMIFKTGKIFKVDVGTDLDIYTTGNGQIAIQEKMNIAATNDMKIESYTQLDIHGMQKVNMSGAQAVVNGSASAEISAGATTTVKGGIVQIN